MHAVKPRWSVGRTLDPPPEALYTPDSSRTLFVYVCFASSLSSANPPIGERVCVSRGGPVAEIKEGRKMTIKEVV